MQTGKKIYGLDSFRFFAFLNVFIFHTGHGYKVGFLGIELFFVLSSFLLSYLALSEIRNTGTFSRTNFFIRRALRIYPLYFLLLVFSFYILPFLGDLLGFAVSLPNEPWYYWFFLSNFEPGETIYALKFFWSIAVEEQFYLLFILLSYWFKDRFYLPVIFLFAAFIAGLYLIERFDWSYYSNPIAYLPNFAAGMLSAGLFFERRSFVTNNRLLLTMLICIPLCVLCYKIQGLFIFFNLPFSFLAAAMILLIINYFQDESKRNFLTAITEHLGKYTYGLYLYSGYVIAFVVNLLMLKPSLPTFMLQLSILILISFTSYHLYEKHFLRLKLRFRERQPAETRPSKFPQPT